MPALNKPVSQITADVSPFIHAKHTKLTIFRPNEADRRSALKSLSRFWFFFRHKKEQEENGK